MNKIKHKEKEPIGKYISQLYRKGNVFINRETSKHGVGFGQFMFLLDLYREDGKNQEEISDCLKIDKGTTARALKKLEEQGFIDRVKNEEDKRCNKIYLCEKAKDIKEDVFEVLEEWNDKISESLSEEEEETLRYLLEKVCKNINI